MTATRLSGVEQRSLANQPSYAKLRRRHALPEQSKERVSGGMVKGPFPGRRRFGRGQGETDYIPMIW